MKKVGYQGRSLRPKTRIIKHLGTKGEYGAVNPDNSHYANKGVGDKEVKVGG